METNFAEMPIREQMDDPETAESLSRLVGRAKDVEHLVERAMQANNAADGLLATVADVIDEQCEKINQSGTSVEERIGSLASLLLKVTEPETVSALSRLVDRLPQLEEASRLLDEVPNLLAIATDVIDEYAANLKSHGVELEKSISQGLHALLWLGCRVSEEELERLGFLLRSDVLDPHALDVVGHAATSLANCQRETCEQKTAERIGVLGLLKSLRDPNMQRTLGFGIRFAKCFGNPNGQTSSESPSSH
ncbi:DUF1641 domain-containing protein [Rubinisphaera italica]|uniref:DUF1641 domain-containing protein n=1 Tax=Rubinisphaera italica TaxID=2527969 RepID=A0A5C5XF59_9PLAN|nr:DUF1641 domain-containing protein [Rubinisphaera italica]TWT61687.1 hypothetical protein Pan54_24240 [Rubinisphaera italica]